MTKRHLSPAITSHYHIFSGLWYAFFVNNTVKITQCVSCKLNRKGLTRVRKFPTTLPISAILPFSLTDALVLVGVPTLFEASLNFNMGNDSAVSIKSVAQVTSLRRWVLSLINRLLIPSFSTCYEQLSTKSVRHIDPYWIRIDLISVRYYNQTLASIPPLNDVW